MRKKDRNNSNNLNEQGFIDYYAKKNNVTKTEAKRLIRAFKETVISAINEEHTVYLTSFGTFATQMIPGRHHVNPDGSIYEFPTHRKFVFKSGARLKKTARLKKPYLYRDLDRLEDLNPIHQK